MRALCCNNQNIAKTPNSAPVKGSLTFTKSNISPFSLDSLVYFRYSKGYRGAIPPHPKKRELIEMTISPGEYLRNEYLEPWGISIHELARRTNMTPIRVSEILRGKRTITYETAVRFAQYFGPGVHFWLDLQRDYDLERRKCDLLPELSKDAPLAELGQVYLEDGPLDKVVIFKCILDLLNFPTGTYRYDSETILKRPGPNQGWYPIFQWFVDGCENEISRSWIDITKQQIEPVYSDWIRKMEYIKSGTATELQENKKKIFSALEKLKLSVST